jgi:hypothetical protein
MHSYDPPGSPTYSGSGVTESASIKDWNETITEKELENE